MYSALITSLIQQHSIKGIAHITGGGLYENVPRIIPKGLCASVEQSSIPKQPIFEALQAKGNIETKEMFGTFNMGVGLVLVVRKDDAENVVKAIASLNHNSFILGNIISHSDSKIIIH